MVRLNWIPDLTPLWIRPWSFPKIDSCAGKTALFTFMHNWRKGLLCHICPSDQCIPCPLTEWGCGVQRKTEKSLIRSLVYKTSFFCSTQLSLKTVLQINLELFTIANSFLLRKLLYFMNMKMPTSFGIFLFMTREKLILSSVEHGKSL